jgi:hypothetical protein
MNACGAPFTEDLEGSIVVAHQLLCFVKEAMGVHVDGLYAFAVHTHGQMLPAGGSLCMRYVEHRTATERHASRRGRAFEELPACGHLPSR